MLSSQQRPTTSPQVSWVLGWIDRKCRVGRSSQVPGPGLGKSVGQASFYFHGVVRAGVCLFSTHPSAPSLHRSSPLQRRSHWHRGPDPRCPVHRPWGPCGGWHCWLLLWKSAHSRSHLFPAISPFRFLVLAGIRHFCLLSPRSSWVIFSWDGGL